MGDDESDNSAEEGVQIYVLPCTSFEPISRLSIFYLVTLYSTQSRDTS